MFNVANATAERLDECVRGTRSTRNNAQTRRHSGSVFLLSCACVLLSILKNNNNDNNGRLSAHVDNNFLDDFIDVHAEVTSNCQRHGCCFVSSANGSVSR